VTKRHPGAILGALSFLYAAQGIPFGFASEYLPVVLREAGFSLTGIAATSLLQAPWNLKILWAGVADRPAVRARSRPILLALQLALAVTVAAYALVPLANGLRVWFALTFVAALFAATQDVFVDAFAVRLLRPSERGAGNVAQVAGYRVGILVGGAGLLVLSTAIGERATLLACAGAIAAASVGAFALRTDGDVAPAAHDEKPDAGTLPLRGVLAHVGSRGARPVLVLALTFKLGMHMAGGIIKPMCVDYGWTKAEIGWAVVTVGITAALVGSAAGGALHRALSEARAIAVATVIQALACAPLVVAAQLHAPHALTTFAIALEHFASGLGTTVLFAALMSATRPANAGLQYTILTSANAAAIFGGSVIGGALGDLVGKPAVFAIATVASLGPLALVPGWRDAARASST
jgi:predicted MFS family arabinose efflux permease